MVATVASRPMSRQTTSSTLLRGLLRARRYAGRHVDDARPAHLELVLEHAEVASERDQGLGALLHHDLDAVLRLLDAGVDGCGVLVERARVVEEGCGDAGAPAALAGLAR